MIVNMLGFNLAWFGLVFWGNIFIPVALIMLAIHLLLLSNNKNEARLVLLITIIGVTVDSLLNFSNFFIFLGSGLTPLWLIVLWACFASTVSHSLAFLSHSKKLQVVVGFVIAPLSYIAGERLDAVQFSYPLLETYIVLGFIWAGLFIAIFFLKALIINRESTNA
tara:strand:+ start:141 stop:635 length:495 start_codon:yes stop_codon:yes gene_type:complete